MNDLRFTFLLLIAIVVTHTTYAQLTDEERIYSNTHGIRQEGIHFFEVEGYEITVQMHQGNSVEKGINKLKRKYSIDSKAASTVDSSFQTNKLFITTNARTSKVTQSNIHYFFPQGPNTLMVIGLQTLNSRDIQLEKFFVRSILTNNIPRDVYTPMIVDSIKFAGRYIVLGPRCRWMGTHNIQCPNLGQMNWAEFRNIERAKEMAEAQHDITANKKIGEVLEEQYVDVVFEGVETKALKTRYKIKIPKLVMGGSNILIIYYVTAQVRGKYVACILSHYTDDLNANKLPPLLNEVMKIKE